MKRIALLLAATLMVASQMLAGQRLSVKDITGGAFAVESMREVTPLSDGESYAQISEDCQRIVQYSFRTGKQTAVLFDTKTARGPKVNSIDGYIVSPDGKRLLIQTETKRIYRHSLTATYYIYSMRDKRIVTLSAHGDQQTPHRRVVGCLHKRPGVLDDLRVSVLQSQRILQQYGKARVHATENSKLAVGIFVSQVWFIGLRFHLIAVEADDLVNRTHLRNWL